MPPRLSEAHRRHSEYYHVRLRLIESLYEHGNVHVKEALDLFDLERENIQTGFSWASRHAEDNEKS